MNAVVYLFQVSACMGIFYLFYYLLLSQYTFFTINRWYLIITLAISFVIPVLTITVQQQDTYPQVIQQVVYINQIQTPQQVVITDQAAAQLQIDWMGLVKIIYTASVAALLLRLMLMVVKFFTRIRTKKTTKVGGVNIVQGDEDLSNGSFFNYIFLNDDELSADELEQIIAHEMLHVKLYHSVDRILVKIAQVFLWFNPFVYLYARAIEENHEFEVDLAVSNSTDRNKYAELLFHLSVARQGTLYHNFSMVPLKKRITMLFTKPTNRIKRIIYLLVVPVVLISCLAFAKLKNEDSAKTKKQVKAELLDSTATVKYRQKTKRTTAQIKADDESLRKFRAYMQTPEGKKKMALSESITSKTIGVEVLDDYLNKAGKVKGKWVKEKVKGDEFVLLTGYGQAKPLNGELKKGDKIDISVFHAAAGMNEPLSIAPAYVIKNGKKIFQLVEAGKIPVYPFLYEANKVRFADGQVTNITKYPNGKWKTAVFERVNGYKFNLSFKPNAPDLRKIEEGDHVTLRFIHEVKTGDKTYNIKDWVAISTDIKDYGIKNPEWFSKFYEVVKADTGKLSAIDGVDRLGAKPLVLINDVEYSKDILYKISNRSIRASSFYPPNNGTTKYGEKAKDGAIVILTRDGEINYLNAAERQNLLKLQAAKARFFSRIRLTKEDGSKYDRAILNRATGSRAGADLATDGKIAFIINGEVYNEAQFKRLFKTDKASYGPSIGVGGASKELKDKGFNLDGYDLVFEFNPGANSKVTNKTPQKDIINGSRQGQYRSWSTGSNPVTLSSRPRAIGFTTGGGPYKSGSPIILTGGQSDYRKPKLSIFEQLRAVNETNPPATEAGKPEKPVAAPEQKDTAAANGGVKSSKQLIAMFSGMEVRADGTLWVNNQQVKRLLINGKEYMGGGVAQAVKTLPAEIVNKVNVSDNPAPNGSKPEKVINIGTKSDKPDNIDMKKDLLNSVPILKAGYKKLNDSLVAASFSGTVITIKDIMDSKLVIVKNGEYFAAYANLKNVNVSTGQEVKKGQLLGVAAFNREENKVAAHLEFYRGSKMITDRAEQEAIIKGFEPPKLNMINRLKEMYAYSLPKSNKAL